MTFFGLSQPPSFTACDQDHHLCHHKALPKSLQTGHQNTQVISKDSLNWLVLFILHALNMHCSFLMWTARCKPSCGLFTILISYSNFSCKVLQSLYYLYTRTKQAMFLPCHVSITNVQFSYGSFNCCSTPSSNGKDNGWNHISWCISQSAYINVTNLGVYPKAHTLMLQILVHIPKRIH